MRAVSGLQTRPEFKRVKWVKPELMHVTLRFLGEVPPEALKTLDGWTAGLEGLAGIPVSIGPLDMFPHVLFFQVSPVEPVRRIFERLDTFLDGAGFKAENRPFVPHVTIGRSRPKISPASIQRLSDIPPIPDVLRTVALYDSRLTPQGPIYRVISADKLLPP